MNFWSKTATNLLNDSNAFIECLNTMDDVYENIDDYNPSRQRKILIAFDDMVADIMTKKISSCNQGIVYYMQKTKNFTCVYHSVLFFCPKRCHIKFNTLFDYDI